MKLSSAHQPAAPREPRRRIDFSQRAAKDAIAIVIVALLAYGIGWWLDVLRLMPKLQALVGGWRLNGIVATCIALALALTVYSYRRLQDLGGEIRARHAAEAEVSKKIAELTEAKTFLNTIVENVPVAIFVRDMPEGRYVLINRDGERFHDIPRKQLLGRSIPEMLPPSVARIVAEHDKVLLQSTEPVVFDEQAVTMQGLGTRLTVASGIAIRNEQ
ncbi:MAG TPA: PAS domain-containing protein, partial [Xanthobacteraceae bacterium]|nr:PAS domain-containing protein [Xanthobacteraceae bacterium]